MPEPAAAHRPRSPGPVSHRRPPGGVPPAEFDRECVARQGAPGAQETAEARAGCDRTSRPGEMIGRLASSCWRD